MLYDKVLGGLIGGGAGDAMGAATEARTTEQILEYFGHEVTDFEKTPMDTFGAGNEPGQLTDDFSAAYFVARHIADAEGEVSEQIVKEALIDWAKHPVFFDRFAGPTTRLAIRKFKGETVEEQSGGVKLLTRQATNGGAMKISPVGLLNVGNIDQAITDALKVTMVTHDNYLAVSGACAVAAAVSCAATEQADLYQVLQAGLYGAREGERLGRIAGRDVAGPSVVKRMELAISIGLSNLSVREKMVEIGHCVGAGLHVSEAIPCAFGFLAAGEGDPMKTLTGAVNVGYDTDTIATMAGAMAGALAGAQAFPEHFLRTLEQANHLEIQKLAEDITRIAEVNACKGGACNE